MQLYAAAYRTLDIPARDTHGTCYYVKLVNHAVFSPSSRNPYTDSEIVSRNHDGGGGLRHPYVLGAATFDVSMEGPRSLKLAGAPNDAASINVDNFIMVGITPTNMRGNPKYYSVYGTSDSTIPNTGAISYRQQAVYLKPFGSAGTSSIAPLAIQGSMLTRTPFQLDVRALDCGYYGETSDIYLVIQ